jgi:hypothetical protein
MPSHAARLPLLLLLCAHFFLGALGGTVFCSENGWMAAPCDAVADSAPHDDHAMDCACASSCTDLAVDEVDQAMSANRIAMPVLLARAYLPLAWLVAAPAPRALFAPPEYRPPPVLADPGVRVARVAVLLI